MTFICPGCNGVGYRPGKLIQRIRKGEWINPVFFEAVECKACNGSGTQYEHTSTPSVLSFPPNILIHPGCGTLVGS
jgi:DnaJ-class molecular chaperone